MPPLGKERRVEARRCTEAIRDLQLAYRARMEHDLRGSGVTLPQLRMLKAIEQQREGSAAAIARSCHVTPQTLQSMLTRATREGWVVRGSSERNGRFVTAALTAKGRAILQRGLMLVETINAEAWRGVPLPSIQVVRKTLETALSNLLPR